MNTQRTSSLLGWVDDRRRPLINFRVWRERTVCALVDTGFNGYLLWENLPSDLPDFGETTLLYEEVDVAGGRILVMLGTVRAHWFDEQDRYSDVESLFAVSNRQVRVGDPVVLLGTAMLSGKVLVVDFTDSAVRIQSSG